MRARAALPSIDVIIPVYNDEAHIGEAISAMQAQTRLPQRILVVDDGSTDGTAARVQALAKIDKRIVLLTGTHQGPSAARNLGIEAATADYIAFFDSDDLCAPDRLAQQAARLDADPTLGVIGTHQRVFGGYRDGVEIAPLGDAAIRAKLLFFPTMLQPTVMVRRAVLEQHHLRYDPAIRFGEDYDLWVRLADVTRLDNVPAPLCSYRWNGRKHWEGDDADVITVLHAIWARQLRALRLEPTAARLQAHALLGGRGTPKWGDLGPALAHAVTLLQHAGADLPRAVLLRQLWPLLGKLLLRWGLGALPGGAALLNGVRGAVRRVRRWRWRR